MAGKSRTNRASRAHVQRAKARQVKQRRPQDLVILEIDLPHAAYDEPFTAIMDGVTMQHLQRYQRALHMLRDVPIFDSWSELEDEDPYVRFYVERQLAKIDSDPVRAMMQLEPKQQQALIEKAKRRATIAYGAHVQRIASDAMQLAVLFYTDFMDEVPDLEIETATDSELEEMFGLPPEPVRDMTERIEQKLNFIRELAMTDPSFGPALNNAINAAVKEATSRNLTGEPKEEDEPSSEEGFQPVNTD